MGAGALSGNPYTSYHKHQFNKHDLCSAIVSLIHIEDDLQFLTNLPSPPKSWNYRLVPQHLVYVLQKIEHRVSRMLDQLSAN